MTRLVWTEAARGDLDRIWNFNLGRGLSRAATIEDALIAGAVGLIDNPLKGRPGEIEGTRMLSLPRFQYLLVYGVADDTVTIIRVWSTAEDRNSETAS